VLKWLRYSGASIAITVNPAHWRWIPSAGPEYVDVWTGPNNHTYYVAWLMLTVRVWIDDGSW
jgi:hypothetical protein